MLHPAGHGHGALLGEQPGCGESWGRAVPRSLEPVVWVQTSFSALLAAWRERAACRSASPPCTSAASPGAARAAPPAQVRPHPQHLHTKPPNLWASRPQAGEGVGKKSRRREAVGCVVFPAPIPLDNRVRGETPRGRSSAAPLAPTRTAGAGMCSRWKGFQGVFLFLLEPFFIS